MELKTSNEWQSIYPDIKVLDPDGWDRKNWEYSWFEEMISLEEYEKRRMWSTCMGFVDPSKFTKTKEDLYAEAMSKQSFTYNDMIKAAEYGYNFHKTTSFPDQEFNDSCVNNTKQWLTIFDKDFYKHSKFPCNPDHNGECLVCDCTLDLCAYDRYKNQDYTYETKEQLEEMFKNIKFK